MLKRVVSGLAYSPIVRSVIDTVLLCYHWWHLPILSIRAPNFI